MGIFDQPPPLPLSSTPIPVTPMTLPNVAAQPLAVDAQQQAITTALKPKLSDTMATVYQLFPKAGIPEKDQPQVIEVAHRAPELSAGAEAYHIADDPRVYVLTDTVTYKNAKARQPDALKKLASIIAHEDTHISNGPDEAAAYARQLDVLRRLNASPQMIQGVERALDSVVKQQQKKKKP